MKACPNCGGEASRVLYLGLPMNLCDSDDCNTVWGFFSYVPVWLPITPNGGWAFYHQGEWCYPVALFHWLIGDER